MSHPGEWPQDRVDAARELWRQGLTASQIARELGGGITRNAVIGQAHRRGWEARKSGGGTPSEAAAANRHRTRRLTHAPKTRNALLTVNLRRARRRPAPKPATAAFTRIPIEDMVEPVSLGVPLLELTRDMCRWPSGDPRYTNFSFCGRPCFGPLAYCEYHARLAYLPVSERSRRRAAE